MSLRVAVLSSGSKATCFYVASDTTALLVDAGLKFKEVSERLRLLGESAYNINALMCTHEHGTIATG